MKSRNNMTIANQIKIFRGSNKKNKRHCLSGKHAHNLLNLLGYMSG